MYGTGLMDEDGGHTAWVGTNAVCLQPATVCDGVDFPLPNANATVGADLDGWIAQFSGQYFGTLATKLKAHAPNLMYFGADNVGTWGVPARKEILQGAAPFVDGLFPGIFPRQAYIDYQAQYAGDKPFIIGAAAAATPDSSLWRYPGATQGTFDFSTQQARGQQYLGFVQNVLSLKTTTTGTYPIIGTNFWALIDFWNEKTDWGLISLNDNPYDGKSATKTSRKDPWGFSTGGEEKDYGDAVDYFKQANSLWPTLAP